MFGSSIFFGIRFFLAGFSPEHLLECKSDIASKGGVVVDKYGPDCTLVVVNDLVYDDPICVTARRDGKVVVTSLWISHSLEAGALVDTAYIMYRPLKELTGIPGANKLIISLTGYQGVERNDIKVKAQLMGAVFSKSLVANTTTHLICYKFEGEKYELARRMNFTKVVNHLWLEDCLKAWKILPEEPYSRLSGKDLEMMEAEAKDSEDEAGDTTGIYNNGITILKNENGEVHGHSSIANEVSIPPTQQSDLFSESVSVNKLGKQPAQGHRTQSQMDAKFDYVGEQNVAFLPSNQIGNDLPSSSGLDKSSGDFDAEKFNSLEYSRKSPGKTSPPLHVGEDLGITVGATLPRIDSDTGNCSPLNSKRTPRSRASLQKAGKFGKSEEKSAEKIIDDVPTFNIETEDKDASSGCVGVSSSKRLADSDASKCNRLKSRKSPTSSLSLQSAGKLSNLDGLLERNLAEEVIADVCTSNIGPDQRKAASTPEASSAETVLFDKKGPGGFLPQKRTADDSKVSHTTPKSQKLTTSASKRIDAAEPRTMVNNSLEMRINGAFNSDCQIGDEAARPFAGRSSPNISSSKCNAKNVAPSRSLAFEALQGNGLVNADGLTCPNTNSVSTSPGVGNRMGKPQNLPKAGAASPGTYDLGAAKSGSPKLNSSDKTGNSVSKPARKKMVARKTLGSRPKVSKRSADAQQSSVSEDFFRDDAAVLSVGQENKEEPAPKPATDTVGVPPTVDEVVNLGSKPHLKSSTENNDSANESKAPPELVAGDEGPLTDEQSHLLESRTRETSGILPHQTDGQGMPVAETVSMKEILAPKKKGLAVKAKKKSLLVAKEVAENLDETEGEKGSDRVKEHVVDAAAKKRRDNMSKSRVEGEKENELTCNDHAAMRSEEVVCNDQYADKGVKRSRKLALKNRCGTLLLDKSKGSNDNDESVLVGDEGQNDGENSGKLAASSNMKQGDMEVENKNEPGIRNDQGTSKVAKRPGKLAGKKRRGTLLLRKSDVPDDTEKKNEPVDGEHNPGKLAGASGILDKSMEDDKENDPIFSTNQGASKGGKRTGSLAGKKRRGTQVLNKSKAQIDEGNRDKPVHEDDVDVSKGGILTEKLTSKSNLSANKTDAAYSKSLTNHEQKETKNQPACFILCGHRLQRKEFQQLIKRLKGKVCRDSHQWSYQASHFVVPDPVRRTEKFFAAAASGSWILKTDYLTACNQAGKFLPEEPYEWHRNGLSEDGAISLEAPRKWRLLRERTGHGAFYGMRIVIYGECIAPPLDTLKRVVKAGDGTILATSPPYTRFLETGVDFAIVSPGMPRVDIWVQEFLRHQIPCVLADYLVEYVCKPGYPLDRHVQYNTHEWAAKSFSKLLTLSDEVVADDATSPDDQVSDDLACQVCGSTARGDVMLVCGNESGSIGCGIGTHIDCCNPPLVDIPEEDWFCPKCSDS